MNDAQNCPDYSVPFWLYQQDKKKRVDFLVKTENGWCNVGELTDAYTARLFFEAMHKAIQVQMSGVDVHCKVTGMEVEAAE